ncbi:hypothetical protein niasHS_012529 [Heterodera schachtii]|uniref:Lipase n=1 Tax=Heterodera schachtii TaxID=97005 RepID=A0ABD2I6F8_HETSC
MEGEIVGNVTENEDIVKKYLKIPETKVKGPFTKHFSKWIESNEYSMYDFASFALGSQASYGGKTGPEQRMAKVPIVFIHGNSDGALADGAEEWAQGWSANIEHFHRMGYTSAELYAITYGDRMLANALTRSVNCSILLRLRRFVEAVLIYTEAEQIHIVAHSMGVTLARKVIQGGSAHIGGDGGDEKSASPNKCHLGNPIRHRVHTLVGIAGANYGLCLCTANLAVLSSPACNKETGFWTHSDGCAAAMTYKHHQTERRLEEKKHCDDGKSMGTECQSYATVLRELNAPDKGKDAHFVVSLWSSADAIIGPTNLVWGRPTSMIPHSDNSTIYTEHSHYSIKWMTVDDQLAFLGT